MNELEAAFFKALRDLNPFLKQLILVGGWVPYVYKTFVWDNIIAMPQFTTDVDFGIPEDCQKSSPNVGDVLKDLRQFSSKSVWDMVHKGLQKFFGDVNSSGPQMVEREFGPDSLISNLRQHIFDTFRQVNTSI